MADPVQQPGGPAVQTTTTSSTGKGDHKHLLWVVIAIFVLAAAAGGAWAFVENVIWSPQNAFKQLEQREVSATSYHLVHTGDFTPSDTSTYESESYSVNGDLDTSNAKSLHYALAATATLGFKDQGNTQSFKANVESRGVNDKIYFKINELSDFLFFSFKSVLGKWYVVTMDDLTKVGYDPNKCQPSDAQVKEIKKLIQNTPVLKNYKRLPAAKVGSQAVRHYSATVDTTALVDLFKSISDQLPQSGDCSAGLTASDVSDLKQQISNTFKAVTVEYWIGGDAIRTVIGAELVDSNSKVSANARFDTTQTKFNQPITVEEPTGAKGWQEFSDTLQKEFEDSLSSGGASSFFGGNTSTTPGI